ncbi:thiamine phosphate synthase [Eubacterium ruminantium]|uniref:thiamine phosphate synthase n=1 Tax=Eubacterium ruminantium TaxID=42322 RepID=UPI0015694738|nr:thiamine phosphate synthase [Eubacterium ruminantium]
MARFTKEEIRRAMLLYAVTDRYWLKEGETLYEKTEEAIRGGATFVQLREKKAGKDEIISLGKGLKELCGRYKVPFILDDDIELTLLLDADGIHVGQNDRPAAEVRKLIGPDRILGVSAHSVEEALRAEKDGADYLGVGAAFATGTKKDASPLSHDTLQAICEAVNIPVVAIGGITEENVSELAGRGVSGVAVVSAIYGQDDVEAAAARMKKLVEKL